MNEQSSLMMLPSLAASIQALSILHYQTVITEDGSNFIDQILKSFGESLLTEAFHYAKASELDEIDFHDIRAASRVLINSGIWNYAMSEGFKGIMKVKDDDEPKQAFPFIEIYNAMKSRDATLTVSIKAAVFFTAILEYFTAEIVEVSEKKAKEVGSNDVNEQLIRDAIDGDEELKAIFFPPAITSNTSEADEASSLLNEIIDLLHIDRSTLKGASEEEIVAIEEKFELPLPSYLRSLLKISDGSDSMSPNLFLFPSLSDMEEQFFYNSFFPKIYRMNRWIPYLDLDYDFCWDILDVRTGGVILQFHLECNNFWQMENAGKDLLTLMKRLKLFRDYLLSRDDKESLKADQLNEDDGVNYEESQGYEAKEMADRYKILYEFSYDKLDAGRGKPSKKKAKKIKS